MGVVKTAARSSMKVNHRLRLKYSLGFNFSLISSPRVCTVRRFLWAVLIIDLLYNNPQPSRFKLGAYNFQFGMTVKESGKNHLADNCLYDRLSRVLEKPGPLIRAIQLFKPTSRRTPLKLPGV